MPLYLSSSVFVSIPRSGSGRFRLAHLHGYRCYIHYSGTLKSRHFPRNCPWNLPVQKESWKDISKEPPCPRNSPWNLPRSRKNLRATLDIEDLSPDFSLESSPKSKRPSCCAHPEVG